MSDGVKISAERFFERLARLEAHMSAHKEGFWGGCGAISIPLGPSTGDVNYSKSAALHLYLLGYEFPDTVMVLTKGHFYFMATAKKLSYFKEQIVPQQNENTPKITLLEKSKDEGQNRENMNELINAMRKDKGKKIGSFFKASFEGKFIPNWITMLKDSQLDTFEIGAALGNFFLVKDESELDSCKRAAILTNKVLKHGFVQAMESVLDSDAKMTNESLATQVEAIIMDPSKINVNISTDSVDSCYTPIIQSGGKYDIKVSAISNPDQLTADVILASMGARYKGYCANVSRTFMVDAPPKVEKTYGILLSLHNYCLEQMIAGNEIKTVVEKAKAFVEQKDATLLPTMSKVLGFAMGLEFRDATSTITEKNATKFEDGMVFTLSVGFHNVGLNEEEKSKASAAMQKLSVFSVLLADTVRISKVGAAEVLTKLSKEFGDVSYNISGNDEEDAAEDEEEDHIGEDGVRVRKSKRRAEEKEGMVNASNARRQKQQELMRKKVLEAQKRLEKSKNGGATEAEEGEEEWHDLDVYRSPAEYPRDVVSTQLKVDLEKEALIVPINGQPVAFHVSTIKAIIMPDPDKATYLRINFYTSGGSLTKDTPKNMASLIGNYGHRACFIKELTFRSLSQKNLAQVHMQFQELRKRVRQREQKAEQEKDLVKQQKLIRIKDQRVPRLQDLTMRPTMTGRKCVGTLEAHQNGLRFTSVRQEVLDILYDNVKHAIYQPCDPKTAMVVVHFHLKEFIMIGKKKQKDVTFFTEVTDQSQSLEATKRSSYDPDELDEEQREREMRRRLNAAFKDFCLKVEKVASHYDHQLQIDVPFMKSAFEGTPFKEMVRIMPTTHCLINLTETPVFCLTISDIEHVHFERAGFTTKAFDIVLIFKDWNVAPKHVISIESKYMDIIQEWLNLVEITYSMGAQPMDWSEVMSAVKDDDRFWFDTEDDEVTRKPAGWAFLSVNDAEDYGDEEGEEEEAESSYDEASDEEESSSEEDSEDSEFEEEQSSEGEGEEDSEEEGQDWDELERKAAADDKVKRSFENSGSGERDRDQQEKKKVRR